MKNLKKFEEMITKTNLSDLGNTWLPEFHYFKKLGISPYKKINRNYIPPSVIVQLYVAPVNIALPAEPAAVYLIVLKLILIDDCNDGNELHPLYIAFKFVVE